MSPDPKYLALRLEGPLQSWGVDSQYSRRNTGLMPTKSAVAGMCCAALGLPRGSVEEAAFLEKSGQLRMIAIAVPRAVEGKRIGPHAAKLAVRRLQDYHTVGGGYDIVRERDSITAIAESGKPRAKGGQSLAVLTHRQYLMDASFGVVLEGDAVLLDQIARALADPKWGLWLGRKTCIPSAPVLAGLSGSRDEALRLLIGDQPLESFTRQEDAGTFAEGRDSLPDQPLCFASDRRLFAPRRIQLIHGAS
jgi:CRISPR system Cascade subunit CasD